MLRSKVISSYKPDIFPQCQNLDCQISECQKTSLMISDIRKIKKDVYLPSLSTDTLLQESYAEFVWLLYLIFLLYCLRHCAYNYMGYKTYKLMKWNLIPLPLEMISGYLKSYYGGDLNDFL